MLSSLYRRGNEAQPRACGPIDLDPYGLVSVQWRPEPQNVSQAVSLLLKTELRRRQSQEPTEDLRLTPLSPWPSELLSYCPPMPEPSCVLEDTITLPTPPHTTCRGFGQRSPSLEDLS